MPFGLNLLCLAGQITPAHEPQIRLVADLGYEGVEVPVLAGAPSDYAVLAALLDRVGLRRCCTAIVPDANANPLAADAETRARGRAHLDWIIDCATALGAESVGGPFHAPIGVFTGSGPTPDEIAHGVEAHRAMADRAAAQGMILSLEPLNRFETHFLNTMEQAAAYVRAVDHPAFGIMYDTFHCHIEEKDQPRAIATIAGHINVLHVSENDRGIPGTGQIDFSAIFRALRNTGFDGWVTVEAFGAGLPELAAATRVWRPLFPDFHTLAAEAIAYVRPAWNGAAAGS